MCEEGWGGMVGKGGRVRSRRLSWPRLVKARMLPEGISKTERRSLGNCIHKGLKEQKSPEPVTTRSQGQRRPVENVTSVRGVG